MGEEIGNIGPSSWSTAGSPYGVVHCYLSIFYKALTIEHLLTENKRTCLLYAKFITGILGSSL